MPERIRRLKSPSARGDFVNGKFMRLKETRDMVDEAFDKYLQKRNISADQHEIKTRSVRMMDNQRW